MLRTIAKGLGLLLLVLLVAGAGLYLVGLRIILDGGGSPKLRFVASPDRQAEEIARHREAQRAEAATPVVETAGAQAAQAAEEPEPLPEVERVEAAESRQAAATPPAGAAYWTDFRGPDRDGHYREMPIRVDWPSGGLSPAWKQPGGGGYASFVIARDRKSTRLNSSH